MVGHSFYSLYAKVRESSVEKGADPAPLKRRQPRASGGGGRGAEDCVGRVGLNRGTWLTSEVLRRENQESELNELAFEPRDRGVRPLHGVRRLLLGVLATSLPMPGVALGTDRSSTLPAGGRGIRRRPVSSGRAVTLTAVVRLWPQPMLAGSPLQYRSSLERT